MKKIHDDSLEWALNHLTRFYDSDFFPKLFEFEAIQYDWDYVKKHIQTLDISKYAPLTPFTILAPKTNKTFRVVHQLDPLDSIIYTAMVYQASENIEKYRLKEDRQIACSYRIKPDCEGSFFEKGGHGWAIYKNRSYELAQKFKKGYALVCDIADFYNQIYLHRVGNIIDETGAGMGGPIEHFLMELNTKTSRGIPVGPTASIVIAETIMADIDNRIIRETVNYTRYHDDIYIFLKDEISAKLLLHELTKYLYDSHRLVLSSEKTDIIPTAVFLSEYLNKPDQVPGGQVSRRPPCHKM